MSTERKLLKIICFLYVLDAIACLAFGGLVLAGAGSLSASDVAVVSGYEFPLLPWAAAFGVWGIVSGVFYLIYAFAGIRGANTPRKIGPFRVMSIIALVLGLIGLPLQMIFSEGQLVSANGIAPLISVIFAVVCVALSGKIAKQAER